MFEDEIKELEKEFNNKGTLKPFDKGRFKTYIECQFKSEEKVKELKRKIGPLAKGNVIVWKHKDIWEEIDKIFGGTK